MADIRGSAAAEVAAARVGRAAAGLNEVFIDARADGRRLADVQGGRLAEELRRQIRRGIALAVLVHQTAAARAGLNATDAQCLSLLALDGPQTPGRLARRMGVTTGGAITAVIDRLERAGYVERTRDPRDRRRVLVRPRPDALARFSACWEPVDRAVGDRLAGLSDEQLEFLTSWVREMNAAVPDAVGEPGSPPPERPR